NWDSGIESALEDFARWNKANMGAGEIDPGGIGHAIEIRRVVKACIGKIGDPLERPARETGSLHNGRLEEARARERNGQETVRPEAGVFKLFFEHPDGSVLPVPAHEFKVCLPFLPRLSGEVYGSFENGAVEMCSVTEDRADEFGARTKVRADE